MKKVPCKRTTLLLSLPKFASMTEQERKELEELEEATEPLDPDPQERDRLGKLILEYVGSYLDELPGQKAYYSDRGTGEGIEEHPPTDEAIPIQEALALLRKEVDLPGLNAASGGHMGYVPGGGIPMSGFGDLLAAIANRYAGVFFASPGAVRMEQMLVRWMARLIGFPQEAGGNLSSGGSIANLSGIVTAREAHGIKSGDVPNTVIYASPHMHHCLDKALRIAGLQECVRRETPLDERYRMRSDILEERIEEDREQGYDPWLVIASAGTTDTGAVDPLNAIAETASRCGLWFHCDAAYGGFFMLTEEGKERVKGIERADSVVLDPHKGLFLPYGSGALLVRDQNLLHQAFTYEANYMKDAKDPDGILSPAEISPELTKHFRGLRIWLPLKIHGLAPFKACSREKLFLAKYFFEEISGIPGIETGPEPDLSIVIFRMNPEGMDANDATEKLNTAIREEGHVFFSSTTIEGAVWLRAAILSFRTHRETIDLGLERLRHHAGRLLEGKAGRTEEPPPTSHGN